MPETTKQVLLRKAAGQIGASNLAVGLKVPEALIEAWISGGATMPDHQLIALARLLDSIAGPREQS